MFIFKGAALYAIAIICTASPACAREFDFKGIHAHDTSEMHQDLWSNADPNKPPCRQAPVGYVCELANTPISGIPIGALVNFESTQGRLLWIKGSARAQDRQTVFDAFVLKWGSPNASNEKQYGVEYRWIFDDGILTYGRIYSGLWTFAFYSDTYIRANAAPPPKVDF